MHGLILLCGAFFVAAATLHFVSIFSVVSRFARHGTVATRYTSGVSILRPVCGIENFIEETLRSSFRLDHSCYELLFCVAKSDDAAIPLVRRLMAENPDIDATLLIGDSDISGNPKLNNLAKGWRQARYDWVLMVDSNVLMPKDQVQQMLSVWRNDTGLVCSPPVGGAAVGPWAELECAFLNTYQARWQSFAELLGMGFAQGKAMLWRRDVLETAGGIVALGNEMAEDAAATKIVRQQGLHVRLVASPFTQPLGYRSAADVWRRQVRWARLRRSTFKLYFLPEIAVGIVPPLAAGLVLAAAAGWSPMATAVLFAVPWYAAELFLAWRAGWQLSAWTLPMCIVRDLLSPLLWIAAWAGDDFEWRGNAMSVDPSELSCELP